VSSLFQNIFNRSITNYKWKKIIVIEKNCRRPPFRGQSLFYKRSDEWHEAYLGGTTISSNIELPSAEVHSKHTGLGGRFFVWPEIVVEESAKKRRFTDAIVAAQYHLLQTRESITAYIVGRYKLLQNLYTIRVLYKFQTEKVITQPWYKSA